MTIANMREICKTLIGRLSGDRASIPKDVLIIAILIAVSLASFGLGYLTGRDAGSLTQSGKGTVITTSP